MTGKKKQPLGEFELIEWIREQVGSDRRRVPVGIGDDAAVVTMTGGRPCIITTDMLLEGVHFDLKRCKPYQVGRKAMAVNLSDVAAMAGMPTVAVVSVGLKRSAKAEVARELFRGLAESAREFGVMVVGGDTTSWTKGLAISVTVLGEPTGRGPVTRGGARPGDSVVVTGAFGGSLRGKHLEFTPRVHEAVAIHAMVELTAMIDCSDGLAADLGHILRQSDCGAVIREADIPIADAAREAAAESGRTPLEHALNDGEDFELVMTMSPESAETLAANPPGGVPVTVIGQVSVEVPAGRIALETRDGKQQLLDTHGYEHACGR